MYSCATKRLLEKTTGNIVKFRFLQIIHAIKTIASIEYGQITGIDAPFGFLFIAHHQKILINALQASYRAQQTPHDRLFLGIQASPMQRLLQR